MIRFLDAILPDTHRWVRLALMADELEELGSECKRLLLRGSGLGDVLSGEYQENLISDQILSTSC
jgi:hypothetical protein